jgi:hypothetical protein
MPEDFLRFRRWIARSTESTETTKLSVRQLFRNFSSLSSYSDCIAASGGENSVEKYEIYIEVIIYF